MPLGVGRRQNVGLGDFCHILTLLLPGASVFHKHMSCFPDQNFETANDEAQVHVDIITYNGRWISKLPPYYKYIREAEQHELKANKGIDFLLPCPTVSKKSALSVTYNINSVEHFKIFQSFKHG